MTLRRLALLSALTALGILAPAGSALGAAPIWNLDIHHNQTNFAPGSTGEYWLEVANVGDAASSGTLTLSLRLPAGLTRNAVRKDALEPIAWNCPGAPGDATITCTTTTPIPRHSTSLSVAVVVNVSPSLSGIRTASAKLEGSGVSMATATEPTVIDPEPAGFGIVEDSFTPDFVKADGLSPIRESGAHPPLFSVPFDLNSVDAPVAKEPLQKSESESIRDLVVDLPPGFIGNPSAVGECSPSDFSVGQCPPSSQVGRIDVATPPLPEPNPGHFMSTRHTGVFNLSHPRGAIVDLAFAVNNNPIHIKASLDPTRNYAIQTTVSDINETAPPFNQRLVIWGVPAASSHDSERCPSFSGLENPGDTSAECSTDATPRPFITVPFQCGVEHTMTLHHYDSWQNTGTYGPDLSYAQPGETTNCGKPRFEPDVAVEPTGRQANTPTGLDVHIRIGQNENPNSLATPPVKSTVVTLPEGMTVSPSFADGLTGCSEAQIALGSKSAVACPDSSRIGAVELSTPLLPKRIEGSMYLAKQGANPFGSTFAVYLAIHDTEERGILVKIPGKLELDSVTGQITASFDDLPQFPFDDFTLSFRSGQRAPLINPPSCGVKTIGVKIASYAQPNNFVDVSNSFDVTEGAGGAPCPPSAAARPFNPQMSAGTINPSAGAYSPFVFRLTRSDSDQEFSGVTTTLAPGILARIAGIPFCSEAAIASVSSAEGTGQAQLDNPSCPPASQIGTVSTGVGAGTDPNYFAGRVYLAGPYKGAPLSMAIVVPALAGPVDLGSVVVRAAIYVDPVTAQVRVVSDKFPTILHGVLLRVRDVILQADRPQTILNPTSCNPMSIGAVVAGVGGDLNSTADESSIPLSSRFQVLGCASLGFAPRLTFRLKGGTHRGDYPAFSATLRARPGDANIARAAVTLPHSEFLAQEHIRTICTRTQFAASTCPSGSAYGYAKAISPLLDEPLEGPVYLRSSSNPLPDLVAKLNGKFEVVLAGRIDSINQGIRNTFDLIPDAPVTEFTLSMQGGKKGLLVNSRNLCKKAARANVRLVGQNGKTSLTRPRMKTACKKGRRERHR